MGDDGEPQGRMVLCTRDEYRAAIAAAGGIESLNPISSYTRMDGDEWGTGKRMDTVWGNADGVPVVESKCENRDGTGPDEWTFWKWEVPRG